MKRSVKKPDPLKKCCSRCTMTDGCRIFVDMVNAEDALELSVDCLRTLLAWYDKRSSVFRAHANPQMWEDVRECIKRLYL